MRESIFIEVVIFSRGSQLFPRELTFPNGVNFSRGSQIFPSNSTLPKDVKFTPLTHANAIPLVAVSFGKFVSQSNLSFYMIDNLLSSILSIRLDKDNNLFARRCKKYLS